MMYGRALKSCVRYPLEILLNIRAVRQIWRHDRARRNATHALRAGNILIEILMQQLPNNSVLIQGEFSETERWLLFSNPIVVIKTDRLEHVMDCLRTVEAYTQKGLYAAGFVSYEASGAMDGVLQTHDLDAFPLVWFGVYDRFETLTLPEPAPETFHLGEWTPSISLADYHDAITTIKQHIQNGDTYQVNYTLRLRNTFSGDPWAFFLTLHRAQRCDYSAYIHFDRHHICSVSPELFFSLDEGKLTCKPMKGTVKRGYTTIEDKEREQWLFSSEKNRAENVMIVDMIRNDMGRIAKTGSVNVEKLFSVDKYPTVLQMTSTVASEVSVSLSEIFQKMFPCASITGAPKVKTMEIIKKLEPDARGVYTGSIGYIAPDGKAQFNVAIRTVAIDMESKTAEYGVGGGIVWDSEAIDEYEECKTKAAVLLQRHPEFDLIETLLWDANQGFYLLDYHLERLSDSAKYFQFKFPREEWDEKIKACAYAENKRVRVTLSRSGKLIFEAAPILSMRGCKVDLAVKALPKQSQFLFHKTTHRQAYTDLLANQPNMADLILWNEEGFITESSIANIVIARKDGFFTPPIRQGLLPGIFRRHLLEQGVVKEKDISIDEMLRAQAIFLVNSVRGWMLLDKSNQDNTWVINSDFRYETPSMSFDGMVS